MRYLILFRKTPLISAKTQHPIKCFFEVDIKKTTCSRLPEEIANKKLAMLFKKA
jgi:hypothetical protein